MRNASPLVRHAARAIARALALTVLAGSVARAQGTLSAQGFGYPGGQLSSRSQAVGGSLAEFDPQSPLNPAALSSPARALVYVQYDPEFRTTAIGGLSSKVTIARFPAFGISARAGQMSFGLSFSSYLDRTWSNTYADTIMVGGTRTPTTVSASSDGGITDVRGAASYAFSDRFIVGLGVHVYPGRNNTAIGRTFQDSTAFGGFSQSGEITYAGTALSLGVIATPVDHLNLSLAARLGGTLDVRQGDSTVLGSARVPNRFGASVAFDGIAGSTFALRWSSEQFSALKGLGSASLPIRDATDIGFGAEVLGPKIGISELAFRAGVRSRDLPFSPSGMPVKELSYSGGLGLPVAQGRGMLDLGLTHAHRTATGADETGWIVSIGLSIKP